MLYVYYLPVEPTSEGEQVLGVGLIHDAILECVDNPDVRKLLMDTTPDEHELLKDMAVLAREPTQDEIDLFSAREIEPPPDADTVRAREILATSPDAITQPQIWELLRIMGRRLGY